MCWTIIFDLYFYMTADILLSYYVMALSSLSVCRQNDFHVITYDVVDRYFWILNAIILGTDKGWYWICFLYMESLF
jgi:hypothetical protein